MALSWDIFNKANEIPDGEVPCKDGEIIEPGSEVDDSPSTKADRKRRRQAIGQRYLLGIVPFIQSASLQGPFDLESGWVNPWKNIRPRRQARPHLALPRTKPTTIDPIETENQTLEEICRYDADIEDGAGEAFFRDNSRSVRSAIDMDLPDPNEASYPSVDGSLSFDSDDEGSVMLQPVLPSTDDNQLCGNSRRQVHLEQENGKKRNADTGWLKEKNIAKRSRYVALDHSSPTPVGGFRRTAGQRFRLQHSSMTGAAGKLQGYDKSQELQSANIRHTRAYDKAGASTNEVIPGLDLPFEECYKTPAVRAPIMQMQSSPERDASPKRTIHIDDLRLVPSFQETEQDLRRGSSESDIEQLLRGEYLTASTSTVFRNRQRAELVYEESNEDLCLDDIHGIYQASRLAIAGDRLDLALEVAKPTELDIRQISSSRMTTEDIKSTEMARQLSRGGALSGMANDQSIDPAFLPHSTTPEIRNEAIVGFEDTSSFRNTPSSASEQSFQYRKTNQRSKIRKTSAISGEKPSPRGDNHAKASITRSSLNLAIDTHDTATISSSFEDESVNEIDVIIDGESQRKCKERSNLSEPHSESSSLQMEIVEGSSPDPLSEGFRRSSQARFTPSSNGLNMADELSSQIPKNVDDNGNGLAQLDPPIHGISFKGLKSKPLEACDFEKILDISVSPSSPLRPEALKSSTGLKSPWSSLKPPGKSSKLFFYDTRASFNHKPQEKMLGANLWPEHARPKTRTHSSRVRNPSPEYSQGAKTTNRDPVIINCAPRLTDSKILIASTNSKQSPWTTTRAEAKGRISSPISVPDEIVYNEAENQTWLQERNPKNMDNHIIRTSFDDHSQSAVQKTDIDQEPFSRKSLTSKKSLARTILPFTSFPSTQILVEATTDNPWDSAIKRSSSTNTPQNVTFSSLPDNVYPGTFLKDRKSFWTPPPPQSVRLSDPNDPFYDGLMAIETVEVDEKSPKKLANSQRIDLPTMKSHATFLPPSPAVGAMAEAFLAADRQILHKISDEDKVASSELKSTDYQDVENFGYLSKIKGQRPRARSSSPLDGSFTIAPNGRLTAVNMDIAGYDGEANLASVIEEMGGYFQGWDVDTELKKAKITGSENCGDAKGRRQRGYLSGVSNR